MNDPTLIADLIRAGLDADLVDVWLLPIMSGTMSGTNDVVGRTYERVRKRNWRESKEGLPR